MAKRVGAAHVVQCVEAVQRVVRPPVRQSFAQCSGVVAHVKDHGRVLVQGEEVVRAVNPRGADAGLVNQRA